ncbi:MULTISPECIES: hypothetical protein [unclassified Endozoicomonas]|uniref:hypothetical protein n=1 Tax=unclassified Endozoicomonas TaxID=2644528 RepID=UPI003BB654C1
MVKSKFNTYAAIYLLLMVSSLMSGCSAFGRNFYSIGVHNDTESSLYFTEVLNELDQYIFHKGKMIIPFKSKDFSIIGSVPIKDTPEYGLVRWKFEEEGDWIEKKVKVKEGLPDNFQGAIYFSILNENEVFISWILKNDKSKAVDCGGYIFEKYHYRAKPYVDKDIAMWQDYMEQKEADLKAGLTDKYKKPKFYDTVTEKWFHCNVRAYLKP